MEFASTVSVSTIRVKAQKLACAEPSIFIAQFENSDSMWTTQLALVCVRMYHMKLALMTVFGIKFRSEFDYLCLSSSPRLYASFVYFLARRFYNTNNNNTIK